MTLHLIVNNPPPEPPPEPDYCSALPFVENIGTVAHGDYFPFYRPEDAPRDTGIPRSAFWIHRGSLTPDQRRITVHALHMAAESLHECARQLDDPDIPF